MTDEVDPTAGVTSAPCSSCLRDTCHKILHTAHGGGEDYHTRNDMIQCSGCGTVSLRYEMVDFEYSPVEKRYYPSAVKRRRPTWINQILTELDEDKDLKIIDEIRRTSLLLDEIYTAAGGGQYTLAAMGIRALLEKLMITKVGDIGSFRTKMDQFHKDGYVSTVQFDAMKHVIDVGHAAAHRLYRPKELDLAVALDVLEGILASIYHHSYATELLSRRTPKRPSKSAENC